MHEKKGREKVQSGSEGLLWRQEEGNGGDAALGGKEGREGGRGGGGRGGGGGDGDVDESCTFLRSWLVE